MTHPTTPDRNIGVKPTTRKVTRDIGPLSVRAAVAPGSLDEDKRTVDVVWTTGARVLRGFFESFYEELSLDPKHVRMDRLKDGGTPLLDSHNGYSLDAVIGVVETAKLEKGRGVATVRFARDEAASAVWAKVKDGILRNVSVGYRVYRMEKVEDGESTIPVYRAVDWEPVEISMVPIPADMGAGVRAASATSNPCAFEERTMKVKAKKDPQGAKPVTRTDDDAADEEKVADAEEDEDTDADDEGDDADEGEPAEDEEKRSLAVESARADERKRITGIQRIARTLDLPDEIAQRSVQKGTTVAAFKNIALREVEKRGPIETGAGGARIEAGEGEREKFQRGAQAWLLTRSGHAPQIIEHAKRNGEALKLDPGEFRGLTLLDLARESLERSGVKTRGLSKLDLVGKALTHRAGGYQSTSDFAVLLEGTINRTLLTAYALAPDTWRQFCAVGSVNDFRDNARVRQGAFGRLDKVNESGEFQNKPIPDGEQETIAAATYGNIIAITRQALINDDLGAFTTLASRLGRAAALSIESDVYALLALNTGLGPDMADGDPLFDGNHDNLGTDSTLSVAGLDADRVIMASQVDQSGNEFLDIRAKVLLVPLALEGTARILNGSEFDPSDGTTPNIIRGMFPVIVGSPRLTGTRRYIFADPSDTPTLEVVFLDGMQTPFLESQEGWRIDGTEWKVRLDYGCGAVDWRGAVTNDGTP